MPRPAGLELPHVKAPDPSRAGAGLGPVSPTWRAPVLALLRPVSPFSEAAARPRVNSPVAWGLARPPALGAGGGWGAGRPDLAQAREGCQRGGGEIHPAPPWALPSAGRRRRLEAEPRGSGRGETPSPRSRRCHHHRLRRRPHWGILPQALPFAWTWLDAALTIGDRDSSSSSLSFLSPLRTSAFPRIAAACHGRPRPPLLEALRTERRSVPARAKDSLKEGSKETQDRNHVQKENLPD